MESSNQSSDQAFNPIGDGIVALKSSLQELKRHYPKD
jgi:hypothetical protein